MSRETSPVRGYIGAFAILILFVGLALFFVQGVPPEANARAWFIAAAGLLGGGGLGVALTYLDYKISPRTHSEHVQLWIVLIGGALIPFGLAFLSAPVKMLVVAVVGGLSAVVFALSWSPRMIALHKGTSRRTRRGRPRGPPRGD